MSETVASTSAAIRAVASAPDDFNPQRSIPAKIALAWMEQIQVDADAWAAAGDERRRRIAHAAKALAGEWATDICHPCPGQQAYIHKLKYINKDVVSVSTMLYGCVPLWLHYYRIIEDMMGTIDELLPKEKEQ